MYFSKRDNCPFERGPFIMKSGQFHVIFDISIVRQDRSIVHAVSKSARDRNYHTALGSYSIGMLNRVYSTDEL